MQDFETNRFGENNPRPMLSLECLGDLKLEKWMGYMGLEFRGKVQARDRALITICTLAMRLDEITQRVRVD